MTPNKHNTLQKKNFIPILLLILNLSTHSKIISQPFNTQTKWEQYFNENSSSLDPIEGIWTVNFTLKIYFNDSLQQKTNQNTAKWAIVKKEKKFLACSLDGESKSSIVSFTESTGNGLYIYEKIDQVNKIKYSANAFLTNRTILEYGYEVTYDDKRKSFIEIIKKQDKKIDSSTLEKYLAAVKIIEEFKWVKLLPIKSGSVRNLKSSGTGFGISSNGIIVTNFHIVEEAGLIKIRGINSDFSKSYTAKILTSDKKNDLTLLQIVDSSFTTLGTIPFIIQNNITAVGENVFVLGYPLRTTMGDEIKLTNGIISSKSGFKGDITSYQISAPVQPGNSGGPLFDNQGNLIGIINAKHSNAENVSYAIKSNYLISLVQSLSKPPKLQTINTLLKKSLPMQVEIVKKFVYIVEVE